MEPRRAGAAPSLSARSVGMRRFPTIYPSPYPTNQPGSARCGIRHGSCFVELWGPAGRSGGACMVSVGGIEAIRAVHPRQALPVCLTSLVPSGPAFLRAATGL